jgi:uncharacterized protein (DUF3084 family)
VLLAFLAFVVLLAGFIAYAADNIARRAGRRHLRLFGMRPKTTALIVAVAAGMGISLASMLAFFALNRQAIRNIEQADLLRTELNGLKKDVVTVQKGLKTAQAERDSANARAEQARLDSAKVTSQLQGAQGDLKTARTATDSLKTQAQGLQVRVGQLTALKTALEAQALKNQQRLSSSQAELDVAQRRANGLDTRLSAVQRQITLLDDQNAQAQAQRVQAQALAEQARGQATQAQAQVDGLQGQLRQLGAARQNVTRQRDQAASQLTQVQTQLTQAQAQVQQARTQATQAQSQMKRAQTQMQQAQAQAQKAQVQLSGLTSQRDAVRSDLATLKQTVAGLQAQALSLKNDNDTLRLSLSSSQANVKHLEDEYTRATSELSASRNTELSFSKNSIVYSGVVASVRSLGSFLDAASTAAAARGARGNPAATLAPASRQALETTLRGLNSSTFVLCRAVGNAAAGFSVDLSCDARPNTLLYAHGSVIRRATVSLQGGDEALRGQVQDLIGDAVLDLTRRGVPLENVLNGGVNTASLYGLLARLAAKGGNTAVIGVMSRDDVKPGSQVDLYADIVP